MKTEAEIRKFIKQIEASKQLECHRPIAPGVPCYDCCLRLRFAPALADLLKWVIGESERLAMPRG